ncbi:MAG: peptidylprolyl isomerase [Gemmatimonadota bacterium]
MFRSGLPGPGLLPALGLLAALALTPVAASAQERPAVAGLPADRILAVVGGHLLLESEWREQTLVLAEQLGVAPGTPDFRALALQSYEQFVQDLIIIAAAERDTLISVDEGRVVEETDAEVAAIRARFSSEAEFLRQLGQSQWGSLAAYRADIQDRKRRELLGEMFLDLHRDDVRAVAVTDAELRAFWEANQASFGERPEAVRFEEIPVVVTAKEPAFAAARARADAVLAELRGGRPFDAAAREHSDDPGSAEQGGDLGWFTRGRMVAAFEAAAFGAPLGELTGPVETVFGFHILQKVDERPNEVRVRHILIGAERTAADRERARAEAEGVRAQIAAGADVDSLQRFALPGDSVGAAVIELTRSELPEAYAAALADQPEGTATVVETATGFSVLVARGTSGGGPITFDEIAPRLRQQLGREKAESAFVDRLREEVYVDIRVSPEQALGGPPTG